MPGVPEYLRLAEENNGKGLVAGDTVFITVPPESLRSVAGKMFNEFKAVFRTCVGVDERPLNNHFSIIHLFTDDKAGLYIAVKSYLPPEHPVAPSISDIVPAADWCELEAWDLLGIEF